MQNHTETWKYIFIYLLGADKIPAGPWGVISVQSIYICGKNTFNVNKWCMLLNVSFFDDLGKKLNVAYGFFNTFVFKMYFNSPKIVFITWIILSRHIKK